MLKKRKRVLKRSESGFEVEFNIIDSKGDIASNSKKLITKTLEKYKDVNIDTEASLNLIEMRSTPYPKLKSTLLSMMDNISKVSEAAQEMDCLLLPLGTYPGKFNEKPTPEKRYKLLMDILEADNFTYISSRSAAFHFHYALPKGVFHNGKKSLRKIKNSKSKDALINSYNLMIAADPAISTMLQSSPFVDGKYLGKDSRIILYRGGKKIGYSGGIHTKLSGALQPYIATMEDMHYRITRMDNHWQERLIGKGYHKEAKKKELLDFVWNPVKINKVGTLEQRSGDITQPKYFNAAAVLIKSVLRVLQQEFYEVKASDIGLEKPFKIEGEKIHIPPISHLRNKLQHDAVWHGFDSKEVYNYTKRFFSLASRLTLKEYRHLLSPMRNLIDRKKTVSDILIKKVKKRGYSLEDKIPQSVCREISLKSAEQMLKNFDKNLEAIEKIP